MEQKKIYHIVLGESELYTMDKDCAMELEQQYGATVTVRPYRIGGAL